MSIFRVVFISQVLVTLVHSWFEKAYAHGHECWVIISLWSMWFSCLTEHRMSCGSGYVKLVKFLSSFCQVSCVVLSSSCQVFKCYVSSPIKCHVKWCCTLLPLLSGTAVLWLQILSGNIYVRIREGVKIFTSPLISPPFCVGGHLYLCLYIIWYYFLKTDWFLKHPLLVCEGCISVNMDVYTVVTHST